MSETIKNPVQKTIHGVKVRKYNYVNVMFSQQAFEDLIEEAYQTGLSIPVLLALKSQPCQRCGNDNVSITIKKDGKSNKQTNAQNIVTKNAER
jgi:hypothetical protein